MDSNVLDLCVATTLLSAAVVTLTLVNAQKKKVKKRKRCWVKPWMTRKHKSVYNNLLKEMCLEDRQGFYDYHRMSRENFGELLKVVSPLIKKQNTKMREAISPAQRLSITLRYLATGESRRSLEFSYRISHSLISGIIPETCNAIFTTLKEDFIKLPTTSLEWQEVAGVFNSVWNFPMCIGALDGKRFPIRKPANSGSEYYDYKTQHSIIMLALVDANYKFLFVDVGVQDGASDAGVWAKSNLGKYLEEKRLQVPEDSFLPFSNTKSPYMIVADDAFPLKTYLMKPYPGQNITPQQKIFNYRLSRARRVCENAFGILVSKFRVFAAPITSNPEYIKKIIFASVALHNYLSVNCKTYIAPEQLRRENIDQNTITPGEWEEVSCGFANLQGLPRDHSNGAKKVRDTLKDYFMGTGQVPWQERMALYH